MYSTRRFAYLSLLILSLAIYPLAVFAQTEHIIDEDFNTGSLDTSFWSDAAGPYPTVIPDDAEHAFALLFLSSAGSQQIISTPYALPALGSDEVLSLSIDVRRNNDSCWFGLYTGYDQPPDGWVYGSTPTLSSMWGIPFPDYHPGIANDPLYPTASGDLQGFRVQVPSESTTRPGSGSKDDYLGPYTLQPGQWHRLDLRYTSADFIFLVNHAELLSLDSSQLYYSFSQPDDWLFMLGDGGTNAFQPTNLSVDNILLIRTRVSVLAVMDAFDEESPYDLLSVTRVDDWYNTFGPDVIFAALADCAGNYDEFIRLLDFYGRQKESAEATPKPQLVLSYLDQVNSVVTIGVTNIGNAPCCGEAGISVGLSYCTSWVPEYCTIFQSIEFGEICLPPGQSIDLEFDLGSVPNECRNAFAEQLATMWTGYVDTDPKDYLGLVFSIGSKHCYGFLPDES